MALSAFVRESEGTGRERGMRGFSFGDSEHEKRRGKGSAPSSHGYGSGSSWGALLRKGRRRSRLGEGRGGCGGAHRRRNRAKMAWLGRSTAAFVTLFLGKTEERGRWCNIPKFAELNRALISFKIEFSSLSSKFFPKALTLIFQELSLFRTSRCPIPVTALSFSVPRITNH